MPVAEPVNRITAALAYLYCGSGDVDNDLGFYRDGLGAELMWRFGEEETTVAAVRLGNGPPVLLATHRPVPSVLPIWAVDNLDAAMESLKASGWSGPEHRVEIPDGPCSVLKDPSGNEIGLLQRTRPEAAESMARSWRDDQ